jgi:hypothetical protein
MYAIRFQLKRNGNGSARKGNENGIGANESVVVGNSRRSPQRSQSELDQAENDAALDEALVADDEEIRMVDFPVRFYSTDDSAAALSCRVSEESCRALPRNNVVASSGPCCPGSIEEPHDHVAHEPSVPPQCRGSVIQCIGTALARAAFTPACVRVEMAETAWG